MPGIPRSVPSPAPAPRGARFRRTGRRLAVLLLALQPTAVPGVLAAQAPDTSPALETDPAIRSGVLPNGLRYYLRENRLPARRAELRLVVDAGSVLEDDDQRGLAHFVEHMAFNGTARFPRQELVHFIEGLGMRFGAHLNASTSFDETVYQLTVPTDSAGILPRALDILEDWAGAVMFDPAEVDRERGVVVEEWRLGLGAEQRMFDRQLPILFQGSRYAERLPIGDVRTLEAAPPDALLRFYRDWYRPDLMSVIAVGDFDAGEVEDLVRERFTRLAPHPSPRPRVVHDVPVSDTTLAAIATDPEATSSVVSVLWHVPPAPRGTVGAFRRHLVASLHDQMLNLRLYELTRREDPPFVGAGVGRGGFVRASEIITAGAVVQDGGLRPGLAAVIRETERARRHGFTAGELTRAAQDLLRGYERAWLERDNTQSGVFVGELVRHVLEQEPVPSRQEAFRLAEALLPGITVEEVDAFAAAVPGERGRVLMVNAPDRPDLVVPSAADLLAVFDAVVAEDLDAWDDAVVEGPLVAVPPFPGPVVAERGDERLGTLEWTLANGARVILKPTDFKADEILMTAWSPGGSSLAPDDDFLSAALAPTLVGLGGLGAFDAVALDKKLAGQVAQVTPTLGATSQGLSGMASPRDLPTFFELLYLTFMAPRADTTAFRAFVANARASLVNRGADPDQVFGDTLSATLTQYHPRARLITAGVVDSLDLGRAWAFYRERFADAGTFTFVFVGSFDPDTLRPLVERWIGGMPSTGRREEWVDHGIRPPTGVVERVVRKGVEPRARTQLVFTGAFEYTRPQRAALRGLAEVLTLRLREELREALGATYGVSVTATPLREPRHEYRVSIGFGSAPERVDELVDAVFHEIEALRRDGPRDDDLAKVREAEIRSRETNLRLNRWWLNQLAFHAQTGEPPEAILDPGGDAEFMTAEAIRDAARRYLDPANYVRVTLLPEG
jgi:zinc protease